MRTPAFRRLPRAVREQQMLDAAVAVFSARGFHRASMDEIAERAGVSKPMVYAYLGAKEELFVACLHREATRLMEAVVAAVGPDVPPDTQLRNGLRAFFGFVAAHRDGWTVLCRQARGQEPFAGEVARMRDRMVELVAGLVARGGTPPDDALPVAYALVGAGESLADWLVDHVDEQPDTTAARLMALLRLHSR
jgi:AcrR family transcriptional regulator